MRKNQFFIKELLSKIKIDKNGCWIYQDTPSQKYGEYRRTIDGIKFNTAHRASYYLFKGIIPDGMMVLHKCNVNHKKDNMKCINPDHLYIGTHKDNMKDMAIAGSNSGKNNPMYGKSGTRLGVILSEEIKRKIGDKQLEEKNHMFGKQGIKNPNFGNPRSEKTKLKISKSRSGKLTGKKNPASKTWKIINPKKEIIITDDLSAFCFKNKINHKSFSSNKTWYGWKCQHVKKGV